MNHVGSQIIMYEIKGIFTKKKKKKITIDNKNGSYLIANI